METALYLRISDDKTGQRAGVQRQEKECRDLAERHGWKVSHVFVDNDLSATTGKERPQFEALLKARPERIVAWHTDRLIRRMGDLERVIDLGVNVHAVEAGHIDLSTPAGCAVARTMTAWATFEGEHKAARQRASNRQRAEEGISVWSVRPFGFDREGRKVFVVEEEARAVREAARRLLAGQTLAAVARDLDARGIHTATGGRWTVTSLKRVLLNPRVGGWITYKGQTYPSSVPAILDEETFDRLRAVLTDPRRRKAPSTRTRYLLSGLAVCGRCNQRMFATTGTGGIRVLRCKGCYLTRRMDLTEDFVKAVVVERLSRDDVADLLAVEVDVTPMLAEIVSLRDRRDSLAELLAEGLLDAQAVRVQSNVLKTRQEALQARLDALTGDSPLKGVADAPDPAQAFLEAPVHRQRVVLATLLTVTVLPVGKGTRWSPEGLRITSA